jgi:mannose-6-phosphate isomerase-like protein (cupin superfamily)
MGQFDEYVYTLPKDFHEWGATYATPRAYFRGIESMQGSRLSMGFTAVLREHVAQFPHFHHSVEEYYWFLGSDLTEVFDFDAEIEIWLGEDPDELEKVVITSPALLRIPPGLWHGPINYKRIGKPVTFSSMYFDGDASKITRRINSDGSVEYPYISASQTHRVNDKTEHRGSYCKATLENTGSHQPSVPDFTADWIDKILSSPPTPHSGKYDQYMYTFPQEFHKWGETFANPRGKFRGATQLPGAKFYGGFSVVLKSNVMEVPHIHHANDEYLWFTGSNIEDIFDFDAEIEVYLGWDPDNMEKVVITAPSVIRVPPNLWHCPVNFKRIDKPVGFLPVYPDGDWSKIIRKENENGDLGYVYEAASMRRCVYELKKICEYCGKCYSDKSVKAGGVFK